MIRNVYDKRIQHNPLHNISITMGVTNGDDGRLHTHDFYELVIILDGTAIQCINYEKFVVSAGDVFIIKENDAHGFEKAKNLQLFNIGYQSEILLEDEEFLKNIPGYLPLFHIQPLYNRQGRFESRLHLNVNELVDIESSLDLVKDEFETRADGCEVVIKAYFMQIVVFLARKYSRYQISKIRSFSPMVKTIHYIEENYMNKITLEQLAANAGLQVNTFLYEFKNAFSTSPIQYIIELRIRKASQMLIEDKKSVIRIANEVGFSDSNYFARLFKEKMGSTPTEFRKLYL